MRALCDLPLPEQIAVRPALLINLLGDLWQNGTPDWAALLALPSLHLHLYGKGEPRPGRKMGHITVTGDDQSTVAETCCKACQLLGLAPH